MFFRHDKPRPYQNEFMEDVFFCLKNRMHLIACAPTGIGKTDGVLSPAITYALEHGKKILFLTPKISQHTLVLRVVRDLKRKYNLNIKAVDIIGKKYMCTDISLHNLDKDEFYEVCRKRNKDEICPFYRNTVGYNTVQKIKAKEHIKHLFSWFSGVASAHSVYEYSREHELCGYEALIELAKTCDVLVMDYYHVFNPRISKVLFNKLGFEVDGNILIVDEAHNLPERIRSLLSVSLSLSSVKRAKDEARVLGYSDLILFFQETEHVLTKFLNENEEFLLKKDDIPVPEPDLIDRMYDCGIELLDQTNRTKSYCLKLSYFYEAWLEDSPDYVRIGKLWKNRTNVSVSRKCLNPASIAQNIIGNSHSCILMSATLRPLEMYADLLRLDHKRTVFKEYPSPFPEENRMNIVVKGVTTRYSKRTYDMYKKIADHVSRIIEAVPGNSLVLFPSYEYLNNTIPLISTNKKRYVQEENMSSSKLSALISSFKKERNAVFFGVVGGSLSEGVDYPGDELLCVVIVGIPLAEPDLETQALIDYYEEKFGKGWSYGYIYPAINKVIQAAGRCIRTENDRGVIVFMDERYIWRNYSRVLPKMKKIVTNEPEKYIREFF